MIPWSAGQEIQLGIFSSMNFQPKNFLSIGKNKTSETSYLAMYPLAGPRPLRSSITRCG